MNKEKKKGQYAGPMITELGDDLFGRGPGRQLAGTAAGQLNMHPDTVSYQLTQEISADEIGYGWVKKILEYWI